MASADDFNWNILSNYVVLATPGQEFTAETRVINATAPTDDSAIPAFIQAHNLQHGDVLNLEPSYRFSECVIVTRDADTGNMSWIQNPDESGSGYLTIPESVLENVTDFKSKYRLFFQNDEICVINYHFSPKDAYITTLFGPNHSFDENWQFDVLYIGEESPECISVKPKDTDRNWGEALELLQLEQTGGVYSCQDVLDYYTAQLVTLTVKVTLAGAKLEEYKAKYGAPQNQYLWISAKPHLPALWSIEKGQTSMSPDRYEWDWIIKGPQISVDEARAAMDTFLQGFTYHYVH